MTWERRENPERTIGFRVQGLRPTFRDSLVAWALGAVAGGFVASLVALPLGLHLGLGSCPDTRNPGPKPGAVGPLWEEAESPDPLKDRSAPHTTANLWTEVHHVN